MNKRIRMQMHDVTNYIVLQLQLRAQLQHPKNPICHMHPTFNRYQRKKRYHRMNRSVRSFLADAGAADWPAVAVAAVAPPRPETDGCRLCRTALRDTDSTAPPPRADREGERRAGDTPLPPPCLPSLLRRVLLLLRLEPEPSASLLVGEPSSSTEELPAGATAALAPPPRPRLDCTPPSPSDLDCPLPPPLCSDDLAAVCAVWGWTRRRCGGCGGTRRRCGDCGGSRRRCGGCGGSSAGKPGRAEARAAAEAEAAAKSPNRSATVTFCAAPPFPPGATTAEEVGEGERDGEADIACSLACSCAMPLAVLMAWVAK